MQDRPHNRAGVRPCVLKAYFFVLVSVDGELFVSGTFWIRWRHDDHKPAVGTLRFQIYPD